MAAPADCPCPGDCNVFGLTQYDCQTSFFGGTAPLSQAYGYSIVVLFGVAFSVITSIIVWLEYKYGGAKMTSENFNTAGRSIKTGLISVVIVSHWTWAATLLQSSNVAYQYGVAGPFWYAAGATIQILLFGILAVQIKRRAPTAHTMLEIIKARWGVTAHKVFFVFAIITNIIVTSMLLLGGASVLNALTGMNIYAAAMLIPCGIVMYTYHGGLKATFQSDYLHTVIIYAALCLFAIYVYAVADDLGSPGKVWENLTVMANPAIPGSRPVANNKEGSYMTMFSRGGLIFGVINVIGNFGTVFVDQAYWMGAIASTPSASYKGYMLGGLLWFCIPFTLATSLGLGSIALDLPVTSSEANAGLVPAAVAYFLMGKAGAVFLTIMLFMAVTASGSAELIAVSSLFAYDVYRGYINPKATGKDIIRVSRYVILGFGVFMGVMAIILFKIGLSLGWVYLFMGIAIGGAVAPIYMCLTWSKASSTGAITGAISGLAFGVMAWMVTCQGYYGSITKDNLGGDYPMLAGNLTSICSSAIICALISWFKPQNYDWKTTREIPMIEEDGKEALEKSVEESADEMNRAYKYMLWAGWGGSFVLVVAWPLLALAAGVFSKSYFTFWVILSLIWGFAAAFIAVFMPLFESRAMLLKVLKNVICCTGGPEFSTDPDTVFPAKSFITNELRQGDADEKIDSK